MHKKPRKKKLRWYQKEEIVRKRFSKEFKSSLRKGRLSVGTRIDNKKATKSFDFISEDNSIVGMVKSSKLTKKNSGAGQYNAADSDLHFLNLVKAKKRLLVLTDIAFYNKFKKDRDGKTGKVEIILCEI